MIEALLNRKIEKRPTTVRLPGRILFLTEDPELIKRQLAGEDLPWDTMHPQNNPKLRDDISTDEITPAHICFFFDETLGEFPYTGLKCGSEVPIQRGDVKRGRLCSGGQRQAAREGVESRAISLCRALRRNQGCDRGKHRAYLQAELPEPGGADFDGFFADRRIRGGDEIPLAEFTAGEDEITRQIIEYGGLFQFNVARMQGKVFLPAIATSKRQ